MTELDFTAKVNKIKSLELQADALKKEATQLRSQLGMTKVGERRSAGQWLVSVERNATFNAAQAEQVLTEEEYYSIMEVLPSRAKAEELLPPARYRACQKEGAPKLVIKKNPDFA